MTEGNLTPLSPEYINRIYHYCYKRVKNSYDADDLAQEIALAVFHAWHAGERPTNFNAWLWTVARNRWVKYLERQQRCRNNAPYVEGGQVLDMHTAEPASFDERLIDDETKWQLSAAMARLAKAYRETVVLYYLESLSIPQIALHLAVPEGTVKRRLHDARRQIKREMAKLQEHGQKSYAPVKLSLWGGYGIPKYWHDLEKGLTKNILAAAYDEPVSVPELSAELGVASVYVEEELDWLVKHRFIKDYGHNRYQTDFVIYDGSLCSEFNRKAGEAWNGLGSQLVEALECSKPRILELDFYGKEFAWPYLLWIFIVYASTSYAQCSLSNYKKKWEDQGLPMYTKEYRVTGTVRRGGDTSSANGPVRSVGWSNLHQQYANVCGHRNVEYANLYQAKPFPNRDNLITAANVGILLRLAQNGKADLSEPEKEAAAVLVGKGVITASHDVLLPQLPIMSSQVRSQIQEIINNAVTQSVDFSRTEVVTQLADEMLLPVVRKDLQEEYVNWIMLCCLSPLNYVLYQCREEKLLALPEDYERSAHALYLTVS